MFTINTQILKIDSQHIDEQLVQKAGNIIRNGGLCAFPTETVYGLGANAFCEEAVRNIFKAKGRPGDNPLIVHISDMQMLEELASEVSGNARVLMKHFMPGPITVIVKKSDKIGITVTAGLDTVAVRFPSHKVAQALIRCAGVPIAAPSANISGKPSPTKACHVIEDMRGKIDCIIDGGNCSAGVESTVVDATGDIPVILRPGVVTYEDIKKVVPTVKIDEHILKSVEDGQTPRCPGMKYKHYAPDAQVFVVEGDAQRVKSKIDTLIAQNQGKRIGILRFFDHEYKKCDIVLEAGRTNQEYAKTLFSALRKFDELGVEIVFAEFREEDGYGLAVKNRLYKSAANRVYYV